MLWGSLAPLSPVGWGRVQIQIFTNSIKFGRNQSRSIPIDASRSRDLEFANNSLFLEGGTPGGVGGWPWRPEPQNIYIESASL